MTRLSLDTLAKIRRVVYIRGYLLADGPVLPLKAEIIGNTAFICSLSTFATDNPDSSVGIEIFGIGAAEVDMSSIVLHLTTSNNGKDDCVTYDHTKLLASTMHTPFTVQRTWNELLNSGRIKRLLDIGGRARVGKSRKGAYPGIDVVVADILPGPDVDITADVHEISRHINEPFDAFLSVATFEHLIMPWKAAAEINKVLKDDAVGMVVTHQTVGIHEIPWDFFRYSDKAWKGIFNLFTGFEILDAGMTIPAMIIPRVWNKNNDNTEHAVGYINSSVVVRKIAAPQVEWDVPVQSIISDMYPH